MALNRRNFLRAGTATGVGLALPKTTFAAPSPRVERYVPLGRTGLEVADIGFGSSRLRGDETLVRRALERGINYFDTAKGYTSGESEATLGRALAGERERIVLASKVHCGSSTSERSLMTSLEESLSRLKTDRIDVYFNHAVNDVSRLQNGAWGEFVEKAKQQGKIRFTGMSGHGGNLIPCIDYALDHDLVDVLLVAYNFGQDPSFYERFTKSFDFIARQPDLPRVLRKARAKGVGIVAMKTLMGAKLNDMRPYEGHGATYAQAAFRWVLSGGLVDSLVVTMKTTAHVDEYVGASGAGAPDQAGEQLLRRYAAAQANRQCRYGCDACLDACPAGVPIAEVLRTRMYALDYEDPAFARSEYRGLSPNGSACLSCSERTCAGACPFGLPLAEWVPDTHRRLRS